MFWWFLGGCFVGAFVVTTVYAACVANKIGDMQRKYFEDN